MVQHTPARRVRGRNGSRINAGMTCRSFDRELMIPQPWIPSPAVSHRSPAWTTRIMRFRRCRPAPIGMAGWRAPGVHGFPLPRTLGGRRARQTVTDPRLKNSVAPFYPDYRTSTRMDYGNRVGIFRLFKLLDRASSR